MTSRNFVGRCISVLVVMAVTLAVTVLAQQTDNSHREMLARAEAAEVDTE